MAIASKTKTKKRRPENGRHVFADLHPKEMAMVLTYIATARTARNANEARDVITELCWRIHKLGWERGQRALKRRSKETK